MRETISSVIGRTSRAGRTKRSKAQRSRQTSSGVVRTRPGQNRLLLVVDESPSSKAAVDYVAKVLGHRRGFQVCLAHFLRPLPPILMEFGGAENPDKERQLDAQLHRDQQQWIETAKRKAEPALNWARDRLRQAGLPATALSTQFSDPAHEQDSASEEILELARWNSCRTIVVGRRSLSWLKRITAGKDLAERLVREGKGLTIWIVE
jgi:nucleotide-binding universal stress UspA family protein